MAAANVPELSEVEELARVKQLLFAIRASLPKELFAGSFTLRSKLPWKATQLRELLLHRFSDIADVAIELYESERIVPAFILTRALVETTSMMYWLFTRSSDFLDKWDEEAYDKFLMKGLVGTRIKPVRLESHNVLTDLDHLDKKFEGLRRMYDELCEFTHQTGLVLWVRTPL